MINNRFNSFGFEQIGVPHEIMSLLHFLMPYENIVRQATTLRLFAGLYWENKGGSYANSQRILTVK